MSRIRTVQQLTSKTTAVKCNAYDSVIQTVALTDAANGTFQFTVNNSVLQDISTILLSSEYTGTGTPVINVVSYTRNAFIVQVTNSHASVAFNSSLRIHFKVTHN